MVEAKVRYGNLIYALDNLQSDIIAAKSVKYYGCPMIEFGYYRNIISHCKLKAMFG